MSETTSQNGISRQLIIALTLINTILVAIIAGLQADASMRADTANRDSQYYAMLASGELTRIGIRNNYEFTTYTGILQDTQEALVLQYTALELLQDGSNEASDRFTIEASAATARAERGKQFSIFFSDPRYAPTEEGQQPNMETYLADSVATANELVSQQNSAADLYQRWNVKSDRYVTVLTILAIAFFLFGLAQSAQKRVRMLFSIFGVCIMAAASLWALVILIS